jgi:hypothetical protein
MTDEIFEPSSSRQDAINELEQLSVVELAERVYALENPAPLSQKEAIWKIRDLFSAYNFAGTFFTEQDILAFSEQTDEPLTAEQVATFCDGWTWRKGLEERMCEEGYEMLAFGIAEDEHLGK